jgi:predicted ThiF/HesA family dinucleotide-utilizing enzyme
MNKGERTYNNLQNITQKTKDRAIQTPLNTVGELRYTRKIAVPAPRVISHEGGKDRIVITTKEYIRDHL